MLTKEQLAEVLVDNDLYIEDETLAAAKQIAVLAAEEMRERCAEECEVLAGDSLVDGYSPTSTTDYLNEAAKKIRALPVEVKK